MDADAGAGAQSEDYAETEAALSKDYPEEYAEEYTENYTEEYTKDYTKEYPEDYTEEYAEECNYDKKSAGLEKKDYSNPIDAYFLPRIENASSEAERRELQDTYRGVWKTEFENIMVWMQDKCVYQEDKDNLLLFTKSVESLIETTHTVLTTDWLDNYRQPPDSDSRNIWGNGTRSALNQTEAEIYRDAGMKLIDDTYLFKERDYSSEHYE